MVDYNGSDYIQGRRDQERADDLKPSTTRIVNDAARELAIQQEASNQSLALVVALKKARMDRDEWKTYAKQLELDVVGVKALVMALRDEINHCPNHSAHPLGRNEGAQLKLHDAAYKGKAKENGLPESNWSDKVKNRAQITDNDKG